MNERGDDVERPGMNRRTLLARMGSVPLVIAAGSLLDACGTGDSKAEVLQHVANVGHAYLKEYPTDGDVARLEQALALPAKNPTDHLDRLDRLVRADFANGRVVRVSGWSLSQTEARAAALVALTRK
ncbi:MAG TPA: hypothetical protein VIB48_20370 [Acidimicrobiia bacterium]